jgi:uncharacterized Ntn-hydrolase superfamily protein
VRSTKINSGVTVATFTGENAIPEVCNVTGPTYAVQANLQTSSAVCGAMASAFDSAVGSLPRRLLIGLKAGTPVGTDQRGEFSASIRVFSDAWPLAQEGITEIIAEACVIRSANWQRELEFDLFAYLASLAPPNPADLVVLNKRRTEEVLSVLHDLGYYRGPVDAGWSPEAEAALLLFEENNIFFPKPTVVVGRVRFIDAPLAEYIVQGARRRVLVPNPEGEDSADP